MTCNNCQWFVEETEEIGDYQHSEAVNKGEGFCLMQPLFTHIEADYETCVNFVEADNE